MTNYWIKQDSKPITESVANIPGNRQLVLLVLEALMCFCSDWTQGVVTGNGECSGVHCSKIQKQGEERIYKGKLWSNWEGFEHGKSKSMHYKSIERMWPMMLLRWRFQTLKTFARKDLTTLNVTENVFSKLSV